MEKRPIIAIDNVPIELWYEGPTYLVVDKPAAMAVHPETPEETGTLVNALLQSNRWLAEMETSLAPGVIHRFRPQDRGLMVVAKSDDVVESLRSAEQASEMTFRYRVVVPGRRPLRKYPDVHVIHERDYGDTTVYDIESAHGNTAEIIKGWLGSEDSEAVRFVCYDVDLPIPGSDKRHRIQMGRSVPLPSLDLYTVPT